MAKFNRGDKVQSKKGTADSLDSIGYIIGKNGEQWMCYFPPNQHPGKTLHDESSASTCFPRLDGEIPGNRWNVKEVALTLIKSNAEKESVTPTMSLSTITTKGKNMFENLFKKNKEIAIQEGQRQVGVAAFEFIFDLPLLKNIPEPVLKFLKTPIGKFALANLIKLMSQFYTGPQNDKVEFITDSLLRGAYSEVGDALDVTKHFEDLIKKIGDKIPGVSHE